MQKRHLNRQQYFDELVLSSRKYFLPYVENFIRIDTSTRVLEIGCGDGGNLLPFAERGCMVTGIDLSESRILQAREFFAQSGYTAQFRACNIFDMDAGEYDFILLHDVIEHIYEKKEFMRHIKPFFRPNGILYIGFPAWQMPFGGHQQICRNKIISFLPFLHLLPNPLYRGIAKISGESQKCIDELMSIKHCRTTIEMFESLAHETGYFIENRKLWFINPHYEAKFHLHPCSLSPFIARIPYIRNFVSTSCFFILKVAGNN
ncbi:Ubiquinone biosynthesis O-methyltransferase [termite gut metagenome]|uniref:Ubiquinone biosynthesis O-methyltransferase n=1 Tax=termite gut metagenome TaxID=433724 RepID=A0A5J4SDI4_9ZZZZ